MTPSRQWRRVNLWCASAAFVAISIASHPSGAGAQQSFESFEHWAAAHALPIATVEFESEAADLRRLKPVIGNARVVALGEPAHGAHEPLAFRNRLFRYLVEELGFTSIAIESGLPESRRVDDYIAGGQGEAQQIVRDNLTWGFGTLHENEELVVWMRHYNADPAHHRKVRFYGIDLSLGGPDGSIPKPDALEAALSYLARVDSISARRAQARLQPLMDRLPGSASAPFVPAEHDALSAAIEDLISLFERERTAFIAASSGGDYEWGHRNAIVAGQNDRMWSLMPTEMPDGGIPPTAWRALNARDSAMAENVRWVLDQEGPSGRVLVFAHDAHVMNARNEGGLWSALERPPEMMGLHLREALGHDIIIIGTSSASNGSGLPAVPPDSGSVDAALARVGLRRFLVDLRAASTDRGVTAWLAERRPLRADFTTTLMVAPGSAFDALLFVDTLTSSRAAPPSVQ